MILQHPEVSREKFRHVKAIMHIFQDIINEATIMSQIASSTRSFSLVKDPLSIAWSPSSSTLTTTLVAI